jgi:hypothetical protein
MRKRLLLAASLSLAMMAAPAAAHGRGPAHPNVGSPWGVRIIVRDGPKLGHHHDHAKSHLRPQPWPRRFSHHAPTWRWHGPWHDRRQQFHWRDREHRPWLGVPHVQHHRHGHPKYFSHGRAKHWLHAPWHHGRRAVRNHFPHARFKHGHDRSERHRDRD